MKDSATTVMERCDLLGQISEEENLLVRPFGTEAMRRVNRLVEYWMRAVGMDVRRDAIGNLIGRYEGQDEGAGTMVLGSHLDSVRDAGKYDGPLGVMVALACVERLYARGERLPFAIEVVGFADEEGLRFGTTYLGSSVYAGIFDEKLLGYTDPAGVTLAEAVRAFGGDPDALVGAGRDGGDLIGYLEVHMEQGPVLDRLGEPVGIVTGITGESSVKIDFKGEAGHAGTVPMKGRKDALCAAAEFVLAVEETARSEPDMVATVGHISVHPGAHNVIPGHVRLGLDLRHQSDAVRERAVQRLHERLDGIAASRGEVPRWHVHQESGAAPTDPSLTALLERAVEELGHPVDRMPSGAGHDAAAVAAIAPIAMLFVRCYDGISHNPAESVETEDVAVAIDVTSRFLELLAESRR
jgi:allantoate deiminase